MVQPNFPFTAEKRIKDVAVSVFFPPRTQLSIPHTVQTINGTRMFVTEQCVKILVSQMTLKMVLAVKTLNVVWPKTRFVQLRPSYSIEVEQDDT